MIAHTRRGTPSLLEIAQSPLTMPRPSAKATRPIIEKCLNELEGVTPAPPTFKSFLTTRVYELRQRPIGQFAIEDLRLMLGQNIGVSYLLPLALARLEEDPLAAGDYYPGDLLRSVLHAEAHWWPRFDVVPVVRTILHQAVELITVAADAPTDSEWADRLRDRVPDGLADEFRAALQRLS